MRRNTQMSPRDFHTPSFLSCEKDCEEILRKLFIESEPYSEKLKRLLVINTRDCIDNYDSQVYANIISDTNLKKLIDERYIRLSPKIAMEEHEEVKSYIILSFTSFTRNARNDEFRDCVIQFTILSHTDYWDIGDFRTRPLKIAGYIDGILNKSRLSGIGQLQFVGLNELVLDETLSGYTLTYQAIHGTDDILPLEFE